MKKVLLYLPQVDFNQWWWQDATAKIERNCKYLAEMQILWTDAVNGHEVTANFLYIKSESKQNMAMTTKVKQVIKCVMGLSQ